MLKVVSISSITLASVIEKNASNNLNSLSFLQLVLSNPDLTITPIKEELNKTGIQKWSTDEENDSKISFDEFLDTQDRTSQLITSANIFEHKKRKINSLKKKPSQILLNTIEKDLHKGSIILNFLNQYLCNMLQIGNSSRMCSYFVDNNIRFFSSNNYISNTSKKKFLIDAVKYFKRTSEFDNNRLKKNLIEDVITYCLSDPELIIIFIRNHAELICALFDKKFDVETGVCVHVADQNLISGLSNYFIFNVNQKHLKNAPYVCLMKPKFYLHYNPYTNSFTDDYLFDYNCESQ